MGRTNREMGWYDFACAYMDMKWGPSAATYRRGISEALTAITPALFDTSEGRATPHAGAEWTNAGRQRDQRQLKNRARGESRTVPCPPELTALLHAHIAEFATGADGRLFPGERAGELPRNTYMRAWRAARKLAFTEAVAASPLAATAYALRHACVSTWLSGGVPPTQVAEWAGHSVEVLLKVYAKTLDGHEELARRRVMEALGHNRP